MTDGMSTAGPQDISELVKAGRDLIAALAEAHSGWGCGTAEDWGLDQTTGLIAWGFPDRIATAPAQILASYNRSEGSWMWALANGSILPPLRRDSERVREWALDNGHPELAEPLVTADEQLASCGDSRLEDSHVYLGAPVRRRVLSVRK